MVGVNLCQLFLLKKSSAIATASSLSIVAIVELRQLLRISAPTGRFLMQLAGEILIARRASPQGPQKKRRREEKKRREEEEEGRGEDYVNIGYACLALMNICYYLII